jgi:hypothetical protein
MAAFNVFQCFQYDLGLQKHNLNDDPLSVYLSNETPSPANRLKVDVKEITKGNGYTGPISVDSKWTPSGSGGILTISGVEVTASGGEVGPFQYVVLCNPKGRSSPLLFWWAYGSEVTLQDGEKFRFAPSAPIWSNS